MPKDARLFAKFALDFPGNPKIMPLSDAAFRCIVEATIWSRDHQTDGFLARRLALASWSLDSLQELCVNDDAKPTLIERQEGWYIRDYAEHQDTKAEIEARRERARTAGQLGGLAKAKRPAKRRAKRTASEMLSKNVAEEEEEEELTTTTNVVVVEHARANNARGARLPTDWRPHEAPEATARHLPGIDIHREYDKFCDYWRAQPGIKGRKTDWDATWRNWLRRAAEQTPHNGHESNGVGKPTQKALGYQQAAERIIAGMGDQP